MPLQLTFHQGFQRYETVRAQTECKNWIRMWKTVTERASILNEQQSNSEVYNEEETVEVM